MTQNEFEILAVIHEYWGKKGFSPSQMEISKTTGRAIPTVRRALKRLETYGYIRTHPNWARSIELVKAA